jgi:GT2 family glycosyltransferase
VVDNYSKDKSILLIKKHAPHIHLITNKKNIGFGAAVNQALRKAKGEYILLLDNDIINKNNKLLSQLLNYFDKKTGLIYVPVIDEGRETTSWYGIYYSIFGIKYIKKNILIRNIMKNSGKNILIGSPDGKNMFFKKKLWEKISGFDESQTFQLDDIDIGPRFYMQGYENKLFTKSYFIHIGKDSNNKESYIKRNKLLFSRHARSMLKNYKTYNLLLAFPTLFFHEYARDCE